MMNGKQVWKTESLQASTYQRCVAEYKKELSCSEIAVANWQKQVHGIEALKESQ